MMTEPWSARLSVKEQGRKKLEQVGKCERKRNNQNCGVRRTISPPGIEVEIPLILKKRIEEREKVEASDWENHFL